MHDANGLLIAFASFPGGHVPVVRLGRHQERDVAQLARRNELR
jgi:hypothetical protein